ncbi:MAG: UDP-N-acetylmuramoyl-L-alanine--D-glutamate ligase [Gorillibacterium sp.]|nr:UDP-N-acetylmuramoyl-L-alanine--D-glutamate ligase [Gorillibacterium sp.]
MQHPAEYKDREIIVLGLARSGVAVAKLFQQYGANVIVNDKKARDLCPEAEELEALGISVVCGGHPEGIIHSGIALVVKNPGIPYTAAPVKRAIELGLEIVTEVEVAYHICKAPIIGVTGSNGKTTTTTWIGQMLNKAGQKPIIAGNIGRALCEAAMEAKADDVMVVELSSFQLKGTVAFRPKIALLLNVYETHLDYHGSLADYCESKAKLFANQTEDDIAVFNLDDPYCRSLVTSLKAQLMPFSMEEQLEVGVYLWNDGEQEWIVYQPVGGERILVLPTSKVGLPGRHNVQNALAATAVAFSAGADLESIVFSLQEFHGVEHRLEFVREVEDVTFINGSKATNPAATIKDLEAFDQSIVLIAGGLDRGMEYDDLLPYFRDRVRVLIALGQTKEKLCRVAQEAGVQAVLIVATTDPAYAMQEAVRLATNEARKDEVVLLSPACASWDMYQSYEERGSMFKNSVHNL